MILITIIIPVYNIEAYLSQCLDSIVKQLTHDIEVIIINDGSTDNSGKIADSYAKDYSNIHVIHQNNQGVSIARNNGLNLAQGEYIWFIDGDDWIANSSIQKLLKTISLKADVIFLGSEEVIEGKHTNTTLFKGELKGIQSFEDFSEQLVIGNIIKFFPWDKVIKKEILIQQPSVEFSHKYAVGEDFLWTIHLLSKIETFSYINEIIYFYRRLREGSASTGFATYKIQHLMAIIEESVNFILDNKGLTAHRRESLLLFSSKMWFVVEPALEPFDKTEREKNYLILKDIYQTYQQYGLSQKMTECNRGDRVLRLILTVFNWKAGYYIYGKSINFRRSNLGTKILKQIEKIV